MNWFTITIILSTAVGQFAADLHVSERHFLRRFRSVTGVTLKQFARSVRIGKALLERTRGLAWADIAYGCGFADQAHMINDFNAALGAAPERALLELAAALHATAPRLPIVFASKATLEIGADALMTAGISDVVRWPIVAEEIAMALAHSSALTRLEEERRRRPALALP